MAAREHAKNIVPVLEAAWNEAKLTPKDIDAIAVTAGPGLIPALLIGNTAAKTLSYLWKKPLLGIHHIEGHIYANFIQKEGAEKQEPAFPLLALVVSGGHTQLVLMRDHFQYEILGETQDDAAGEAFDKVAKMLGLPYPGGPVVAKRAAQHAAQITNGKLNLQSASFSSFPRPMIHSNDFNFSFSGLKTAVLYTLKKHQNHIHEEEFMDEVCYQFQEAVVDVLVAKTQKAIEQFQPQTFVIAGGVSANTELRTRLSAMVGAHFPNTVFLTPEFTYSLDNAAMIGAAACLRFACMTDAQKEKALTNWQTLKANPTLTLLHLSTHHNDPKKCL